MDLHVVVVPDGRFWFAQGIEWDYAAGGESIAELKDSFRRGLKATCELHLQKMGKVAFAPMPEDERVEYGVTADGKTTGDALASMGGFLWTLSVDA